MTYPAAVLIVWNPTKATANLRKHGVSFEDAQALLESDSDCLEIYDVEHSNDEERFISIGVTAKGTLVVVWTEQDVDVTRIISARSATRREEHLFLKYLQGSR